MPVQLGLLRVPDANTSKEDSIEYLTDFASWLKAFFYNLQEEIGQIDKATNAPLFEEAQISYLSEALQEMNDDGHFRQLENLIKEIDINNVFSHGLYGAQLRWKLSNINFSFERFVGQRTAALFDRLLSSIDALLDSILGAVPGGSAVKELKEAVRNSVSIVTE